MTARKTWALICDKAHCGKSFVTTAAASAAETRNFAQAEGWVSSREGQRRIDLCPTHNESHITTCRVFIPWIESDTRPSGGYRDGILISQRPRRLWRILPRGKAPRADEMPEITRSQLVHGLNAHLEDEGHDWNWRDGVLRYSGASGDTWVLLEF